MSDCRVTIRKRGNCWTGTCHEHCTTSLARTFAEIVAIHEYEWQWVASGRPIGPVTAIGGRMPHALAS